MNIGRFFPNYFYPGGCSHTVDNLSRAQVALGHNVTIFAYFKDKNQKKCEFVNGIKIKRYLKNSKWPFEIPVELTYDLKCNTEKLDILSLHSLYAPANYTVSKYAIKAKIPYIVLSHGAFDPIANKKSRYKKLLYKYLFELKILNNAVAIHAYTDQEMEHAKNYGAKSPIIVCPNGIDINKVPNNLDIYYISKKLPITENKRIILFLGRLDIKHKGLDLLIKAFALFIKITSFKNTVLILVGPSWNGTLNKLKKLVKKLNLEDFVYFLDPVYGNEKYDLMSSASIFVHISRYEAFGHSIVEAMACGCPVLISNRACISTYIERYNAGIITYLSIENIAMNLIKLLSNNEKLLKMRENAKLLAKKEFDYIENTKLLTRFYDNLIA